MNKKFLIISLIVLIAITLTFSVGMRGRRGQEAEAPEETVSAEGFGPGELKADYSDEVYYWGSMFSGLPLFKGHDIWAFHEKGKELGVQTKVFGPEGYDMAAYISSIEQIAAKEDTSGIIMLGWGDEMIPVINETIDKGVPIVLVDSDVPGSNRLAFCGTDWYKLGWLQAEGMLEHIGNEKGKVALMGIVNMSIMQDGFRGFTDYMKEHAAGQIEVLKPVDEENSTEVAAKITADYIAAYPDLIGVGGFSSQDGPGIALAVKEAGKAGKVRVTCVSWEEQHLSYLKEGVIQRCVGQKREFFTYYGLQLVFDAVHNTPPIQFTIDDSGAGITNLPDLIYTGFIVGTNDNVDILLESRKREREKYKD
jgi:ABC-type sugar transport system substrate-binding protein